jgi:hypothetical protein
MRHLDESQIRNWDQDELKLFWEFDLHMLQTEGDFTNLPKLPKPDISIHHVHRKIRSTF